jgi:hypothetical protein
MVSGEWCEALFAIRYSPFAFAEHDLRQTWPAVAPAFITIVPGKQKEAERRQTLVRTFRALRRGSPL